MRISQVQRLHAPYIAIDDNAGDAAQLPSTADAVGRAAGLVAETHVIGILVVERDPLLLAGALDVGESDGRVVAVDACEDDACGGEGGFLFESRA